MEFDSQCQEAIDLAKKALPEGAALDVVPLMAALYHATSLKERLKELAPFLAAPQPARPAAKVPLAETLKAVLQSLADHKRPIAADELFKALLTSDPGRAFLIERGMDAQALDRAAAQLDAEKAAGSWRSSPERQQAKEQLDEFGRMLTDSSLLDRNIRQREDQIRALIVNLRRMKNRSTIILGPPGTGKTALVRELAWRLAQGHKSIPERLRDLDIFELSPTFLRAGASLVGQYEERVKHLLKVLLEHPKIVLFVDEIHALLQSGVHHQGPFNQANESFKGPIARGELTVIGCTTLAEYKHYIEPDKAMADRFSVLRLEPPTREATLEMVESRRPKMEEYFKPLRIPDEMLRRAVELTDDYLPARYQPRKALQLLDEACAACTVAQPPLPEVTEEVLIKTLENAIGRGLALRQQMTVAAVYDRLRQKLIGQDQVLQKITELFIAGLGGWARSSGPRGVFLFGGPTGVGKTETAVQLAEVLGGGKECLIRVDCNTLQGSGLDSGPALNRLLGVPPGYLGFARGQGGILSRIRDLPECVVLFDELEKADPGVGKVLLQIMDDGRVEDTEGTLLDFRRSFVIFTTNAGCSYHHSPAIGFLKGKELPQAPSVETRALFDELHAVGLGPDFCARIDQVFLFQPLDGAAVRQIVELQLQHLQKDVQEKDLGLEWEPKVVEHVESAWKPHFGVRALTAILRNRILAQLSIAQVQGELEGVRRIRIRLAPPVRQAGTDRPADSPWRERKRNELIIYLPSYVE